MNHIKAQTDDHKTPDRGGLGRVSVKLFLAITDERGLTDRERCVLAGLSQPHLFKYLEGEGERA